MDKAEVVFYHHFLTMKIVLYFCTLAILLKTVITTQSDLCQVSEPWAYNCDRVSGPWTNVTFENNLCAKNRKSNGTDYLCKQYPTQLCVYKCSENVNKPVFAYRQGHKYSNQQLRLVNKTIKQPLSLKTLANTCVLGINKSSSTEKDNEKRKGRPRGKRGGSRKQRKIAVVTGLRNDPIHSTPSPRNSVSSHLISIDTRQIYQETSGTLKVMSLNAQSVKEKTIIVNDLILEQNADLIIITETWLLSTGHEVIIQNLTPHGFKTFSSPRLTGRGGGICVIYRDSMNISVNIIKDFRSFECMEVICDHTTHKTTYVCIYRPPPNKKNNLTKPMFISDFADLLDQYVCKQGQHIFLGDINLHYDNLTDGYVKSAKTILSNHHLRQLIGVPTHRLGHILDWLIVHENDETIQRIQVMDKAISDHFVVLFDTNIAKPKTVKRTVTSRNLKSVDMKVLKLDIESSFATVPDDIPLADHYNNILGQLLDKHAPLTTRTLSSRPPAPWLTVEVKQAKQERCKAERKWRKTELTVHRDIYVKALKHVKEVIVRERTNYFSQRILHCSSLKTLYTISDELCGKTKASPLPNNIITNELPDTFCQFFIDKVSKIRHDLDAFGSDPYFEPFEGHVFNEFKTVSKDLVKEIILSSPPKSCSLDPIPTVLLTQCIDELAETITDIINASLTNGSVPTSLKKAIVVPLLKKHNLDPNALENYRPVSNLPFISKILEKVVLCQLKEHLTRHNLIEPFQSAYREYHSTETALLRITSDLLNATDEGMVSILTLLDLSAAFDTIDHPILLERLSTTFGLSDTVLSWFESYLSDRCQSVVVNQIYSKCMPLVYGVPQGSVLGPILYTLYTQPLGQIIRSHQMRYHMYADDTQLYKCSLPCDMSSLVLEVQDCIESIKTWMQSNKLKLNDDKTEIMPCSTETKLKALEISSLTLSGCVIDFSEKAKNLGVILDSSLTMDHQINQQIRIMYGELRKIGCMKSYLSDDAIKKLVVTSVMSRLDYCNSLLIGIPVEKINRLQRVQNNAARLVLKRSSYEHSTPLLRYLHWLPVKARIEYKIATFCFRSLDSTSPSYILDLLTPYTPSRALRSQDSKLISVPRSNLRTYGDRAFTYSGPTVWNSLPLSLRTAKSFNIFKSQLKTYLFNKYLSE